MKSVTLACNECGAPLPVDEETRFVTCAHCGARLAIQRREDAAWTEVVEDLKHRQQRLTERVDKLEHGAVRRRARFLRRQSRRNPETQELDPAQALVVVAIMIVGTVLGTGPGLFWSVLMVCVAIGLAVTAVWLYQKEEQRWGTRREARRRRRLERAAAARRDQSGQG